MEEKGKISLRDFIINEELGPSDVRIAPCSVGICGSDIHYYLDGEIGSFIVNKPMILGHEASGRIIETGYDVKNIKVGDRVCIEPGIPDWSGKPSKLGLYNLDPGIVFWATPPWHGCLRENVVMPESLVYKLPDHISFEEGAMVEPLAVGVHAATKAGIKPGDVALVLGAGTIGWVTALAALASGCSRVVITDVKQDRLAVAEKYRAITPVCVADGALADTVEKITDGWGCNVVFETTGSGKVYEDVADFICPGGTFVIIGTPHGNAGVNIGALQVKEATIKTIFRYANVYDRALALLSSSTIDVKPLITNRFSFDESVEAFEFAAALPAGSIKTMINF
jgi:D-xylulose reductase